jgi:hypothetical protein
MLSAVSTKIALAAFAGAAFIWQASARADDDTSDQVELRDLLRERSHDVVFDRAVPFIHGVRLDDAAMYRLVGREDLARRFEARSRAAGVLALTGLAGLVAGTVVAFTAPGYEDCTGYCREVIHGPRAAVGMSMAALMPLLGGIALAVNPKPLSPEQRIKMADDYNGLVPAPVVLRPAPVVAPSVVPDGAGMVLRGVF